jgi:phosphoglycolate phosphatase
MAIRLLIFDLDGTLVDSVRDICEALNYAIGPSPEPVSLEETKAMIGEGVTTLLAKLLMQRHVTTERTVLLRSFLDYYSSHLNIHTAPYPGVRETLDSLSGYKKAVVSNKLQRLSVRVLELFNLIDYFDYVMGGDMTPERKPSPKAILPVLEQFKVKPAEALLIGDSIYDVEAGYSAGVKTVAAMYGYGGQGFAERADYRINDFGDILKIVRELNDGNPEPSLS